uniref:NADH-ubiquinone oxidoreductase chain 1 n=1 Tax=Hyaloraphidium curvatum TaxID=82268 RepID=NU1M_HYACU|nr:NADH dehydrogenase subunit 1 [Hyaloraphidium curvatum]Q950U8.1 RecName: Full=NADH-ubiquinone oxidoreductase chain 1; AltName: Full=NADH dehydrogenase subunit 1 [Hyaloraphidium curvatum]AAK83418.1 NADH dehydrogenase subunit 1 [Hyaloraphidium curvatum]
MKSLIVALAIVLAVAFMTLAERKLMGSIQRRLGPNHVGFLGLLQPFADGIKLILKETVLPLEANHWLFVLAPFLSFYLALLNWLVIPLAKGVVLMDMDLSILLILAISSLGVYAIIYTGWSANSKYTLLGSLRSTAQMVSYEIAMSLLVLTVVYMGATLNLTELAYLNSGTVLLWSLWPMAMIGFVAALAETNRAPFDLPEAESELVAGFMTEHSAISFTFLFLGEYANIITISTVLNLMFLGFYNPLVIYLFIWIRATLPRLRFDQLLRLGWQYLLPFLIGFLMIQPSTLFVLDLF